MNERQAEKHKSPIVKRFGPKAGVSGIKPTQTKKKHIVPIPILNPLNGDFSMVDRVSWEILDRLIAHEIRKHEANTAIPFLHASQPRPPYTGGDIIQ